MPATPTRMMSFAPRTGGEALVPAMVTSGNAALAAAAALRKVRRVILRMMPPHCEIGGNPCEERPQSLHTVLVLKRLGYCRSHGARRTWLLTPLPVSSSCIAQSLAEKAARI